MIKVELSPDKGSNYRPAYRLINKSNFFENHILGILYAGISWRDRKKDVGPSNE